MATTKSINTLIAGAIVLSAAAMTMNPAMAGPGAGKEKCYGVVKAGMNGCGNAQGTHSCAGQATTDGDWGEWVAVPKGLCDKLANGSTKPMDPAKAS